MTISEEDRKAAEEFASQYKADHSYPIVQAFLAGIEHERKRCIYYEVKFPDEVVQSAKVGWPLSQAPTCGPIEQVGERHWRIKE